MLDLIPVTLEEANEFTRVNHCHHNPVVGHKYSIGITDGDELSGISGRLRTQEPKQNKGNE